MIRKVFLFLAALLALLIVVGLMLPNKMTVERSIRIAASPITIFRFLNNFEQYSQWSPWHDETMSYEILGPEQGEGAILVWQSERKGEGQIEIVEAEAYKKISMRMGFAEQGDVRTYFLMEPSDRGTLLRWQYELDLAEIDNPFYRLTGRYMAFLMDDWIASDFDRGLARVKLILENT